jgi:hypothetical protein
VGPRISIRAGELMGHPPTDDAQVEVAADKEEEDFP